MYAQQERHEEEKKLPEYVRNILDMARSGHDVYGNKITPQEAESIISGWCWWLRNPKT